MTYFFVLMPFVGLVAAFLLQCARRLRQNQGG